MRHFVLLPVATLMVACAARQPAESTDSNLRVAETRYLAEGDADGAERALMSAIEAGPDARASFLLADLYDTTGRPREALSRYFDALRHVHRSGDGADVAVASAMAVVAIRDRVEGFFSALTRFMDDLGERPGRLPLEAWYQLTNLEHSQLRLRGRIEDAEAARQTVGCLHKWQKAGPFGPWLWDSFEHGQSALISGPWPERVSLGPGRGQGPVGEVAAESCFVTLDNPALPLGGVSYARTVVTRAAPGRVWLRLQTSHAAVVYVDGREILRRDTREAFLSKVAWASVALPEGDATVTVKLASDGTFPAFSLVALDETGSPAFLRHASDRSTLPRGGRDPDVGSLRARDAAPGVTDRYARAKQALFWDDMAAARPLLDLLSGMAGEPSPAVLLCMAELTAADPALPGHLAYEQARPYLAEALAREPRSWQARVGLAYRELDEDRILEAVAILEEGLSQCPGEVSIPRKLAEAFLGAGWEPEAAGAVERIASLMPTACNTYAWQSALAERRLRFDTVDALSAKIRGCDAFSEGTLSAHLRAHRYEEAIAEATRLLEQSPDSNSAAGKLVHALTAAGDIPGAAAALERMLARDPLDAEARLIAADAYLHLGDAVKARAVIEAGLGAPLAHRPTLMSSLAALDSEQMLAPYRIDGLEVIAEYRAAEIEYENAAVYVLDRAVYKADASGGMAVVVHTITHLKTDEAVESHGELTLPDGAQLLTARTIKADGAILEPEAVENKHSLSMPELTPGDFVESEYVFFSYPNQLFPGGFDTERFFFQDFETAFHRTEFIAIVPESMPIALDPRGDCPAPTEVVRDGFRELTFRTRNAAPYPAEPLSPNAVEFLPSIRLAAHATFENLFKRVADELADKNRRSFVIDAALQEALAGIGEGGAGARRRAIYRWVVENITPEQETLGEASHIIAERTGNRTRAFVAMLRAAGLPARLVFVKAVGGDETPDAVASLQLFTYLLADVGDGEIIDLSSEHAPYGFLTPALRNRPMRYVDDGALGDTGVGRDPVERQDISMDIELDANGRAKGRVREVLSGALAVQWRSGLSKNRDAEQERIFQGAYLAGTIPGAVLTDLEIGNQGRPEEPLIFEYGLTLPGFARREGDEWRIEMPFGTKLSKQAGGLPARVTDLVMGVKLEKGVSVNVVLPEGMSVVDSEPAGDVAKAAWGYLKQHQRVQGRRIVLEYQMKIDIDRVAPSDYASFLTFAQALDRRSKMTSRYAVVRD